MTRKELEHTQASNDSIRVCFISPKAYPLFNPDVKTVFGGAEVDLYFLATELAKDENFAVSFITADYGQEQTETIKNVKIIKSLSFRENPLAGAIKVWRAMRTADAQIYFHEAASWGTFLAALFCKLHKGMFIYRTASQRECDGTYSRQHYFAGKAFRWSLQIAAQVVVQNETDQEGLKRTMGVHSIVIPNAHNLPVLSESKRETVLWVGRSAAVKRPELFIDLAEKMSDEHFTMICQRATGDEKYEELVARARGVKNLEFIERVGFDEVENYFQRAKVFVNTSESEGFPNTFIQACKCAAPILSLNVNPDNFLSRYKCGICTEDNWEEFVQQLKTMLGSGKLAEYGKNARKYAEQKHDIKSITDKYKELFSSLESNMTASGPNLFVKNYEDTNLAEAEFERTLAVYEQVVRSNPSRLRIAKPIEVKDSTVYFEKITGCFNLRKSICKLRVDTEILYHVGQALAELHLALNAEPNSLDDNIHIHGDFSATNVLYQRSTGLVYIVDFAPYRYDMSESYSYAPAYRDLAHIVLTLEIKYPMHKIYLLARKKNEEMSARFWAGYENVIGRKINRNKLFEYITGDIDLSIKRWALKNPISRLVWVKLFKQAKKRYISLKELSQ